MHGNQGEEPAGWRDRRKRRRVKGEDGNQGLSGAWLSKMRTERSRAVEEVCEEQGPNRKSKIGRLREVEVAGRKSERSRRNADAAWRSSVRA